jgi:hypothetical protein
MTEKFEPKFNNLPKQENQQDVSLNKEDFGKIINWRLDCFNDNIPGFSS